MLASNVDYYEDESSGNNLPGQAGVKTVVDDVATLHGVSHNDEDVWYLDEAVFVEEIAVKKVMGQISVKIYESDDPDFATYTIHETISSSFAVIALDPSKYYFIQTLAGSPNGYQIQIANQATALPVELVRFEGKRDGAQVQLEWATASEQDNMGFDVERSTDKSNWETIGFVGGMGDASTTVEYTFTDERPLAAVTYYRLRQVDFDGNYEYSDAIAVGWVEEPVTMSLFPNPASDRINVAIPSGTPVVGAVFNRDGQRVMTFEKNEDTLLDLNISSLQSGMYFLSIYGAEGETLTQAFHKR